MEIKPGVPFEIEKPLEHKCIDCISCVDGKKKKKCLIHVKHTNFTSFPFQKTTCKDFKDKTQ